MARLMLKAMACCSVILGAAAAHAGVLIGAHIGFQNNPNFITDVTDFETSIGRKLSIDSDYDDWGAFPDTPRIVWDIQTGHIPMQSWRVLVNYLNPLACATGAAISAGTYDTKIDQQAAAAKAFGSTLLVRYNYEMANNVENTCFTGFLITKDNSAQAGQIFIAAWRHIVGRFRAVGATNVKWVWAPGAQTWADGTWKYFYPGSAYVDWVGIDDYNIVDTPSSFVTDSGMPQFIANAPTLGKPLMVTENGAYNDPKLSPDPQTTWINTAHAYMKNSSVISAYVYWNDSAGPVLPPPYTGSGYLLQGTGLAAFKSMANDPAVIGH